MARGKRMKPSSAKRPILAAEDENIRYLRGLSARLDNFQVPQEDMLVDKCSAILNKAMPELEAAFQRAAGLRQDYSAACAELSVRLKNLKAECVKAVVNYALSDKGESEV